MLSKDNDDDDNHNEGRSGEGEDEGDADEDDDVTTAKPPPSPDKRPRRDSEDSTDSTESYEQYIPVPPDGGWGWVIVLASLVCNMIVDGIGYSFGVFLLEFADYFEESKSKVSLVGSLLCGVYMLAGPIVSALTNKFGCRPVAVVGSAVAGFSFLLSTFSNSVEVLMLTYGVMGGFGLGMIYLPAIVSVGYYFEKKRALATGIAVCGSGIGTFVFAPLSEYLLQEMHWRNALRIIAGITLNAAVFAMLMRPLQPPKKPRRQPRAKNLLDRIKEQSKHKRNRTISENSAFAFGSSNDTNAVLQRVMQAKLRRERRLQDTDSELGSLPSIFFTRQQSRKDSAASRVHKLSFSDWGEVNSFLLQDAATVAEQQATAIGTTPLTAGAGLSPMHAPLETVIEGQVAAFTDTRKGEDNREKGNKVAQNDQRAELPAEMVTSVTSKGSEATTAATTSEDDYNDAVSTTQPEDTVTVKSDYFTPPSSPTTPEPASPEKESTNVGVATRFELRDHRNSESEGARYIAYPSKSHRGVNGSVSSNIQLQIHEVAPLLEVPGAQSRTTLVTMGSDRNLWRMRPRQQHQQSSRAPSPSAGFSMHSLNVSKRDLARPLYRKDIFYSGSVLNIPQYQSQPDVKSYVTSITTIPGEVAFLSGGESKCWQYLCFPQSVKDTLQEMMDISLLKDPRFLLICFGNVLVFLGFYVPFVYIVDLAKNMLVDDKSNAAFLISIIGIANTIGRVVTGWLADLRKIDSLVITFLSIFVCGIATALFPLCNTYVLLCVVASVFGLSVAAFISLSSILICDLMGLEKLTNGFGLLCVFRGVAAMAGPPLAGAVYDEADSYDPSFYLGGALLAGGALCHMALLLPCVKRYTQDGPRVLTQTLYDGHLPTLVRSASGALPEFITIEEITGEDAAAVTGV